MALRPQSQTLGCALLAAHTRFLRTLLQPHTAQAPCRSAPGRRAVAAAAARCALEGIKPVEPKLGPATPGGVEFEGGVEGVAARDAVAHAQHQVGGRAVAALQHTVAPDATCTRWASAEAWLTECAAHR